MRGDDALPLAWQLKKLLKSLEKGEAPNQPRASQLAHLHLAAHIKLLESCDATKKVAAQKAKLVE